MVSMSGRSVPGVSGHHRFFLSPDSTELEGASRIIHRIGHGDSYFS